MQVTKTYHGSYTTSQALQDYLPFQLLHSSMPLNWPGIIVRHYSSRQAVGCPQVPSTPDTLLILNLSQTSAYRQSGFRPMGGQSGGNVSCVPAGSKWSTICNKETHYLHVHILSELWNKLLADALGIDAKSVEMRAFSWIEDSFIEEILLKLYTELKCEGKGSGLYVELLSHALVVHLFRHYLTYRDEGRNDNESLPGYKLKKVLAYISENLSKEITLQELGSLIGFSSFHFARLFKANTGLAPYQYITKMRMEHSQRLLLETDLSVIQIGFEVGIENPSYFSSFFKQYTGVTPTVFRKSVY